MNQSMPDINLKSENYNKFSFKPSIIPSVVTVALLYLMVSLGIWQLDRADYKANLQSIIESKQGLDAIPLKTIGELEKDWLYQPVLTQGEYDIKHQIYFDNQVNNMLAGYSVFTPLKLSDTHGILVNRGWLAQGKTRSDLPDISIDTEHRIKTISGLLSRPPSKGLVLSSMANNYDVWPPVLQYIDPQEIEQQLDYKLLPMVLIINHSEDTNLEIKPVKINMRSEKHTAYAFQWFALSLALLIIYIVVNSKRKNKA